MGKNTWFLGAMGFVVALAVVALGYLVMRGPPLRKIEPENLPSRKIAKKPLLLTMPVAPKPGAAPKPALAPLPKLGESDLAKKIEEYLKEYDEIVNDPGSGPSDADRIATLRDRQQRLDKLVEKIAALGAEAVPLLAQVLTGGDARRADVVGRQTVVIRALSRIPGKEALAALGDALRTLDSFTLKMTIVAQLADNGGAEGADILAGRLAGETDPRVRSRILNYLGQQKGGKSIAMIARAATDDENPNVRIAAIRALGEASDPSTAGVLEQIARTSDDIGCRQNAIQIDARLVKEQAILMLQDFLTNDPNLRIKSVAILALQEVGGDRARAVLDATMNDASQTDDVRARARGAIAMLDRQAQAAANGDTLPKIEGLKPISTPIRAIAPPAPPPGENR